MDGQLLLKLYHRLFDSGKCKADPRPSVGCVYSDALIVLIYFLGVINNCSGLWASARKNWPLWMRRLKGPSYSQFMKRLKTFPVERLMARLFIEFRDQLPASDLRYADGKALPVGGFTKDPDAKRGKLPGDYWGKGYKAHLLTSDTGVVQLFTVTSLNMGESTVMQKLVTQTPLAGMLVRVDSNYDSNALYQAAAEQGGRLLASRKKPFAGLGNHPQHPDRLRAIKELEATDQAMRSHRRQRIRIEQEIGHLTNLPFGLSPLPNFVRRITRVTRWVLAKLTLYHLHLILRKNNELAA